MYDFAIVALLALGTVKVVDFLTDNVSPLRAWKSVLTFIAAIGVVVALDYSLFSGFGITVRNETLGVWITGFMVAGATVGWRADGYMTLAGPEHGCDLVRELDGQLIDVPRGSVASARRGGP